MSDCLLSIIIPVLNEAPRVKPALQQLQALRNAGAEVILVDGGSDDQSLAMAAGLVDQSLQAAKGRAIQMNAGAAKARGKYLLFLHIDTRLQLSADQLGQIFNQAKVVWGFFPVRLSGHQRLLRIIETAMNWRSRLTLIATGDQCLFVKRSLFKQLDGFARIDLMEDIDLCKRLRKIARPFIAPAIVVTSSRKWERQGIIKTVFLMWYLRLAYFLGAKPTQLANIYYG